MKKSLLIIILALQVIFTSAFALSELDLGNTKFIAAVVETEYGIEIWLNTRTCWVADGCLIDSYPSYELDEVENIKDSAGLCELQESVYEPCQSGRTVEEIKMSLMKAGVEIDKEFQNWAEELVSSWE